MAQGAPPDPTLNRRGDLLSAVGALLLGLALLSLGQWMLAATAGLMHALGKLFPRGDRSPAIVPVAEETLRRLIAAEAALTGWQAVRSQRVSSGFYTSQALQLTRGD